MRGGMAIGGLIGRRDRPIGRGGETTVVLREHVVGAFAEVVTGIFSLDDLLVGLFTLRTGHCHFVFSWHLFFEPHNEQKAHLATLQPVPTRITSAKYLRE